MEPSASLLNQQKIKAVKDIHTKFKEIMKHEKCRICSCLYMDVLNFILEKIKKFQKTVPEVSLAEIENDFMNWTKEAGFLKMHE